MPSVSTCRQADHRLVLKISAVDDVGDRAAIPTPLEVDLRETALILSRAATDTGDRTDLDEAITAFGFDRAELEAELDADLAAGRG